MKKFFLFICIAIFSTVLYAQDEIDITFRYYPTGKNIVRAFVPGTFNNWGPNSSGLIAPNAPSQMTWVDSLGCYIKTVHFEIGFRQQYKFHEHYNASGTSNAWFTDPLNPLINYSDNNNSILDIGESCIFQITPKPGAVVSDLQPTLTAGVFTYTGDSILLDNSTVTLDGTLLSTFAGHFIPELSLLHYKFPVLSSGSHRVVIHAETAEGQSLTDSTNFTIVSAGPTIADLPEGIVDGINYVDDNTVTLSLYAPYKHYVHVIGDFTDWAVLPDYQMHMTPDSLRYWLTISNLEVGKEYVFQYLVDGQLRIADPYADKILDPANDPDISATTYPNLIPYPQGKTQEIASVLQTAQPAYPWAVTDFQEPQSKDLIIYELLVRDFTSNHDFKTLTDTLDYFTRLGVNAIELMPVSEFEGNISWGYNPSFYFATDKYYGPKNDFKKLVDQAHKRGIAVIMDMVLNHAYGQCPLVRLYLNDMTQNPWFNVSSPNPVYSWGYDFNHESAATQAFVDRVTSYWVQEYHVDGFRFDFTKGFTNTPGDGWYRDPARIAILKRMADHIWSIDPSTYVILEHFTENYEEKILANYGMLIWGNMNTPYSQSSMGWLDDSNSPSDLSWGFYKSRDWDQPNLVTYMESHDEPWIMYKNLQYGRNLGTYNIRSLSTALDRYKLISAFFFTLPGTKMMWQFGEMGYDQNLPESGYERVNPKPILWNYLDNPDHRELFNTIASLIELRNRFEVFRDTATVVGMRVAQGQYARRINLTHPTRSITILGNFDIADRTINPTFQSTGMWYDYFSNDSMLVEDTQAQISLAPGEFHIYSNKRFNIEDSAPKKQLDRVSTFQLSQNYPNPFNPTTQISYQLPVTSNINLSIYNLNGQLVRRLMTGRQETGQYQVEWDGTDERGRPVGAGLYLYRLRAGDQVRVRRMILIK
ncbi:T9SS type A sorting domain-containing protein [candidate division KSB1 bacterium]|nr:T9SS type A sorting domain-containing protein [candidate division KSB1 bacterium]